MQLKTGQPPQSRGKWCVPISAALSYILAALCAIAHLLLFRYLNGKRLEIDTEVPQSWIAPISLVFALTFRAALCSCLSVAFAQHMWRVIHESALPLKTIDRLYGLQRHMFTLFHWHNICASPILFLLICLYWSIPLAVIFPSGALTVEGRLRPRSDKLDVPVFDPAHIGNRSWDDALRYSLAPSEDLYEYGFLQGPVATPNLILSSAGISLVSEHIYTIPSPCGTNCTYAINFEGPYVLCNETVANITLHDSHDHRIFIGDWNQAGAHRGWKEDLEFGRKYDHLPIVPDAFTMSFGYLYLWNALANISGDRLYFQTVKSLACSPCRASYNIQVNYTSGVPEYSVKTELIDCLSDFWHNGDFDTESFQNNESKAVDNLRATNHWILIDSLVSSLAGSLRCQSSRFDGAASGPIIAPNNRTFKAWEVDIEWCFWPYANRTIITNTPFNTRRFTSTSEMPEILITQDLLNEALANITLSVLNRLNMWHANVDTTRNEWVNTFIFAQPTRLILSYFIPLVIAIPFLTLGWIDLLQSKVVAPTEGLIDTLILGAKSEKLRDVARNVSFEQNDSIEKKRLGEIRVRYGRLMDGEEVERVSGLGLEHELRDVKK